MSTETVTITGTNVTRSSGVTTAGYLAYDRAKEGKPKVKRAPLRPVRVTAKCPAKRCRGEMVSRGGTTSGMGPTLWRHVCDKCGDTAWYADSYPRIEYEEATP